MSKGTCVTSGCGKPVKARHLCNACYQRESKYGRLSIHKKWVPTTATEPQPVVFGSPLMPPYFWERITVTDTGCWRWGGALNRGYGVMRVDGKTRGLHLITYEVFVGPRPDGLQADHTCHTYDSSCYEGIRCKHRSCCNPLCLEFVPQLENTRRAHQPEKPHKAQCPAGHSYEAPSNVYYDKDGYPDCAVCRRARWNARYHRNKAKYGTGRPKRDRGEESA